jgi:hypothetical protein
LELFAIMDKAFLGRGVLGIFSDFAGAESYLRECMAVDVPLCEIRSLRVIDPWGPGAAAASPTGFVFAAYMYDQLHDQTVFEGLYPDALCAREAVGDSGLVVRFLIDAPDAREIIETE